MGGALGLLHQVHLYNSFLEQPQPAWQKCHSTFKSKRTALTNLLGQLTFPILSKYTKEHESIKKSDFAPKMFVSLDRLGTPGGGNLATCLLPLGLTFQFAVASTFVVVGKLLPTEVESQGNFTSSDTFLCVALFPYSIIAGNEVSKER